MKGSIHLKIKGSNPICKNLLRNGQCGTESNALLRSKKTVNQVGS